MSRSIYLDPWEMYYINPNVKNLNRIYDQNERKDYLRLDLNENPGGLPEDFIQKVLKKITPQFLAQYPETMEFTESLANFLKVKKSNLCLVNGSAEGIRYVIQTFTSLNGRIVGVFPSYFMFQIYSEMYGREFVKVPYNDDLTIDVNNIIKELTAETQLLILLNPNNPMGNVYTEEEFEKILNVADKNKITVLVDEAYHYFYPNTFLKYALERQHVFVTRTFSKFFSLAGCRLGYIVGREDEISIVQKMCTPHNTNAFAMLFAEEIIKDVDLITELEKVFWDGRNYLIDWLDHHEYSHVGEAGNFIFIKPKHDAAQIVKEMKEKKKILIKSYSNLGTYGDCLRVSIGEKKYMEIFTSALLELDA